MDSAGAVELKRGGVIIRVIGALLVVVGLWAILGMMAPPAGRFDSTTLIARAGEQFAVLGVFRPGLFWVIVHSAACAALYLFAGVQLMRLKRSGWVAAVVILGYSAVSLLVLFVATSLIRIQLGEAPQDAWLGGSGSDPTVKAFAAHVAPFRRVLGFYLMVRVMALLYVLTERRLFFGELRRTPRPWQTVKVAIVLLVVGGSATWAFWGGDYVTARRIIAQARAPDPALDDFDMRCLSASRQSEVAAILIRRLESEKSDAVARSVVKTYASWHLRLLTPEDTQRIIEVARTTRSVPVRLACYEALGYIGTKEARECLIDALEGPRDKAWGRAVWQLGYDRCPGAPDVLLKYGKEIENEPRDVIAALGRVRDERVMPVLAELRSSTDREKRWGAVMALGMHPGPESERLLRRCLQDQDVWIFEEACQGLVRIGTASSIPALIEELKRSKKLPSRPSAIAMYAAEALHHITGEDLGEDAAAWEDWWKRSEPTFDLRKGLAKRLLTPVSAPPGSPPKPPGETQESFSEKASASQAYALEAICDREMRELAPELAKYMLLPDKEAPWKALAAEILAEWGFREGIECWIERVDRDEPGYYHWPVTRTLGVATGVNFFGDKPRWQQWWKENRDRFPSALEGTK
jgi:HEAT repeat protein